MGTRYCTIIVMHAGVGCLLPSAMQALELAVHSPQFPFTQTYSRLQGNIIDRLQPVCLSVFPSICPELDGVYHSKYTIVFCLSDV